MTRQRARSIFAGAALGVSVLVGAIVATALADEPTTLLIHPDSAPNTGPATSVVITTELINVSDARLQRADRPDVVGEPRLLDPLVFDFDITDEAPGLWDVVVSNADGSDRCVRCFTVTAEAPGTPDPSPAALPHGTSGRDVTLTGANFFPGATVGFSAPGITLNSTTRLSTTQILVNIDIAPSTQLGPRDITVTNTDGKTGTCTACFLVQSAPGAAVVTPEAMGQGATTQPLTVVGSEFAPGASVSIDGAGVSVQSTTFISSVELRAVVSIAQAAPLGQRTVTATNLDGGSGSCAGCFTVAVGPTVTLLEPGSRPQGAAAQVISVTGDNFDASPSVSFGSGVTVTDVARESASKLTATISVSDAAAVGPRSITVTNADHGIGTCEGCFTVAAAPTIDAASPSNRGPGATDQDITITGTGFVEDTDLSFAGAGVALESVTFLDAQQLIARIDVAEDAPAGARTISIANPDGGSASCSTCFAIDPPVSISSLAPSGLGQGATADLTVAGDGFGPAATLSFAHADIVINDVSVQDASTITANISVAPEAALGPVDVEVDNQNGGAAASCEGCLTINAAPSIAGLSPDRVPAGAIDRDVTLSGSDFQEGASIGFSGAGIEVASTTFVSETEVIVTLDIDAEADQGLRDVSVTNPDGGVGDCQDCFTIGSAPSIDELDPNALLRGAIGATVTVRGSDFEDGAAVAFSGAGIAIGSTEFVSETELALTLDVDPDAEPGVREVTVSNPDGGVSPACECFTVLAPSVTSVSPTNAGQGATNLELTLEGVGFEDDATVAFSGAGIEVDDVSILSDTQAVVRIDIALDAEIGPGGVSVDNPSGSSAECTECFTVNAAPALEGLNPSVIGRGTTDHTIRLLGSGFQDGASVAFSGNGISLNSIESITPTRIVVNVDASDEASAGARSVTVTNPDAGAPAVCDGCLTVSAVVESTDFDGDGVEDLAIGAPGAKVKGKAGAGSVTVLYGSSSSPDRKRIFHRDRPAVAGSAVAGDAFGTAVAFGDFDGDGYTDLAIGAPGSSHGNRANVGSVSILYGSKNGIRGKGSQLFSPGVGGVPGRPAADSRFGAVLAVGDFNGDGYTDLAIGAPGGIVVPGGFPGGTVTILSGGPDGLRSAGSQRWHRAVQGVKGPARPGAKFGSALAAADFNNDGFSDLAIGVPGDRVEGLRRAGSVNVLHGSRHGLRTNKDQRWHRAARGVKGKVRPDAAFGSALAAGDFNGDGHADLAIGVPGDRVTRRKGAGSVNVLYGSADRLAPKRSQRWHRDVGRIKGRSAVGHGFGAALAAGDFNGNGFTDLAIGVPGHTVNGKASAGAVNVIYGSRARLTTDGNQLLHRAVKGVRGKAKKGAQLGASLRALDLNGDGRADLAIGAPRNNLSGIVDAGAVNLLYGSPSRLGSSRGEFWRADKVGVAGPKRPRALFGSL